MLEVTVVCSSCAKEAEVLVEDLDAAEREVCECGYCFVIESVAEFEPIYATGATVVELRRRAAVADLAA